MPSIICPSCRHPIDFEPSQAGRSVRCPNCGTTTRAIDPGALSPGATPPPVAPQAPTSSQAPPVAGSDSPKVTVGWTCSSCGATNTDTDVVCAACRMPRVMAPMAAAPSTDAMAIASLIFGLIGCVPILPQVLAVGLGAGSLRKIRRGPGLVGGAGLAWAGLALGLIFGAIWVAFLVGVVKHGSWAFTYTSTSGPTVRPVAGTPGAPPETVETFPDVDEALERVGRALKVYMQDFNKLPAQLADLVPSYARRDELTYTDGERQGRPFNYVDGLDPARDEPNAIVVYTDPLVPPPPDYYGYGRRYGRADQPNLWEKGRAPRGIRRMILTSKGDRSLVSLDEFDARLARQRGPSTRPDSGRRTRPTRPGRK